jgi:hypothetical protein
MKALFSGDVPIAKQSIGMARLLMSASSKCPEPKIALFM